MGNTSDSLKNQQDDDVNVFLSSQNSSSLSSLKKEDFSVPFTHKNRIFAIIYDPLRNVIWTGSSDKTICSWHVTSGRCIQTLNGHISVVSCLAIDENGNLYSGSYDRSIYCWNVKSNKIAINFGQHKNWVTCLAVHDGLLFSGGFDCVINCYHIKNNKILTTLKGHSMRVEDLKMFPKEGVLFSSSVDGTIRQWNVESGKCMKVFSNYKDKFINIFNMRKEKCFNIGIHDNMLFTKVGDEGVKCWNLNSKRQVVMPFLGISSFSIYENVFVGWNISSKSFEIWDLKGGSKENECLMIHELKQDILKSNMVLLWKSVLFYVIGNQIIRMDLKKILKKKSKKKNMKMLKNNVRRNVYYSELFHYFVAILKYSPLMVKKIVEDSYCKGEFSKCKNFDERITLVEQKLIKLSKKDKRTVEKLEIEKKEEGLIKEEVITIEKKLNEKKNGDNVHSVNIISSKRIPKMKINLVKTVTDDDIENTYTKEQKNFMFEKKIELFYMKIIGKSKVMQPMVIVVRRDNLVFDACKHFSILKNDDFKKPMYIFFADEEGLDTGGVSREFYHLLSKQIMDPNNALFLRYSNNTYHPNPSSEINKSHLQYFEFIGKLIGKGLYDMQMIDLHFTPVMFKFMCGKAIEFDDLKLCEPIIYSSLVKILEMDDVEVLDLSFTSDINDFGKNNTHLLIEGGDKIKVTNKNRVKFCEVYARWYMIESVRPQLEKLLKGMFDVIPQKYFTVFNEKELELLLCGSKEIEVNDWKENTVYEGYHEKSEAVEVFWKAIESIKQTEHAKLLQFITGTSLVPLEGFSALIPKFSICKMFNSTPAHFPVAHTCLNRIEIPLYKNVEQCLEKLRKSMELGKTFDSV